MSEKSETTLFRNVRSEPILRIDELGRIPDELAVENSEFGKNPKATRGDEK
jgi:hypothetical protein